MTTPAPDPNIGVNVKRLDKNTITYDLVYLGDPLPAAVSFEGPDDADYTMVISGDALSAEVTINRLAELYKPVFRAVPIGGTPSSGVELYVPPAAGEWEMPPMIYAYSKDSFSQNWYISVLGAADGEALLAREDGVDVDIIDVVDGLGNYTRAFRVLRSAQEHTWTLTDSTGEKSNSVIISVKGSEQPTE